MASMVRVDVCWKATEEELDLIGKEPANKGPVADLDDIVYRVLLLSLLDGFFKYAEEILVRQGNPSGTG
jgi:hypothetical protein